MSTGEHEIRIRPGRIRHTRGPQPKSFINRVVRAAKTAGHIASHATVNGHHMVRAHSTFGSGRISFGRERLFSPARRVTVKARIVRHQGGSFRSAPLAGHLAYLRRETLEAVRLVLFTDHTAFVVAADEAMIEYAVRKHFSELPDTTGPRDYARNYLEKLIQVPFRIPALGESESTLAKLCLNGNGPIYCKLGRRVAVRAGAL